MSQKLNISTLRAKIRFKNPILRREAEILWSESINKGRFSMAWSFLKEWDQMAFEGSFQLKPFDGSVVLWFHDKVFPWF